MATEKIINNPTVTDSEVANFARGLHHKRGQWLAAFYETAKKHGIDLEPIYREAIYQIGVEQAKALPMYQQGNVTVEGFSDYWYCRGNKDVFEKTRPCSCADCFTIELGYCPLVKQWQEMGLSDEMIDLLCDIAMEGDRGEAETLGMELDLEKTIGRGDGVCRLTFRKKEENK